MSNLPSEAPQNIPLSNEFLNFRKELFDQYIQKTEYTAESRFITTPEQRIKTQDTLLDDLKKRSNLNAQDQKLICETLLKDLFDFGPLEDFIHRENLDFEVFSNSKDLIVRYTEVDETFLSDKTMSLSLPWINAQQMYSVMQKVAQHLGTRFDQNYPILQRPWRENIMIEMLSDPASAQLWIRLRPLMPFDKTKDSN